MDGYPRIHEGERNEIEEQQEVQRSSEFVGEEGSYDATRYTDAVQKHKDVDRVDLGRMQVVVKIAGDVILRDISTPQDQKVCNREKGVRDLLERGPIDNRADSPGQDPGS